MYSTGILYELDSGSRGSAGDDIGIRLVGASGVDVLGSEGTPLALADMASLAPDDAPFSVDGWYSFGALPRYVAFSGTATNIEVSGCLLSNRGAIS